MAMAEQLAAAKAKRLADENILSLPLPGNNFTGMVKNNSQLKEIGEESDRSRLRFEDNESITPKSKF